MAGSSSPSGTWADELWGDSMAQSAAPADKDGDIDFALARKLTFATPELTITTLRGDPVGVVRQILWALRVDLRVFRMQDGKALQERFAIRQRSLGQSRLYDVFDAGEGTLLGSLERERMGVFYEAPWNITNGQGTVCGAMRYVDGQPELFVPSGDACARGKFTGLSGTLMMKFQSTHRGAIPGPLLLGVTVLAMAHHHGIVS